MLSGILLIKGEIFKKFNNKDSGFKSKIQKIDNKLQASSNLNNAESENKLSQINDDNLSIEAISDNLGNILQKNSWITYFWCFIFKNS